MNIRKSIQILLIWMIILGIFYPAIFSGINSVDDQRMLYALEKNYKNGFLDFFLPGNGFYYRPLLMLTFSLDYYLWGTEVSFYHLENIIIHGASATLIFYILRKLIFQHINQLSGNEWPLIGALLFALHPIVTESVNWISGRTDLLGTFFVLAATLCLLHAVQLAQLRWVGGAVILLGCGILSKEVMVFFVPAAAFLLWRWSSVMSRSWRIQALSSLLIPFVCGGVTFLVLRWFRHGMSGDIDRLILKYHFGVYDTVRIFFKVFGFYGKKIVAPLPLNFAILQVSDLYVWLGLFIFVLAIYLFSLRQGPFDLILVSWFLILPGIFIALIGVAWTPLAERYIYLPSAFFVIGVIYFLSIIKPSCHISKAAKIYVSFLLFIIGIVTVNRNFIWQDNENLYSDSIKKSPKFAAMNNELAIALIDKGDYEKAIILLEDGKKLKKATPLLYINQARIYVEKGDLYGAREEVLKIISDKNNANIEALKMLARIDEKRLHEGRDREVAIAELIDTYGVLIDRTRDSFFEYRLGQLLLITGQENKAAYYFKQAFDHSTSDAHYRDAAGKLARKLSNNSQGD